MEKPLNTTGYAVLGLLAVRPWTTYELAKQVQRSLGWFWPRAERKLYDIPRELVARGLASVTEGRTGRRARSIYRITPAGRLALGGWLDEPPAPPTLEFEAMVKVFFADSGSLDQLQRTLDAVAADAESRHRQLEAMIDTTDEATSEFGPRLHVNALGLRFHLEYQELLARWAAWARVESSAWPSIADPGGWRWRDAVSPDRRDPG
ncbi:MAG: helix-turn-helix transcriptional regulator [Ilumatobacteraceae bacterium]